MKCDSWDQFEHLEKTIEALKIAHKDAYEKAAALREQNAKLRAFVRATDNYRRQLRDRWPRAILQTRTN